MIRAWSIGYRQWRPQCPGDPTHRGGLVIWADDVEVAVVEDLIGHVVDGLFWRPSTRGLWPTVVRACEACVDPSGAEISSSSEI